VTASRFLLSMCFVAAGCVVSPQPSPPDFVLDGDRIGLRPGVELVASVIGFEAGPGAVDPPEGVVVVTNLDDASAPSFAAVQADGSFAVAAPGQSGQRFRFQAKSANRRSQPFDVAVGSSGEDLSALASAAACLTLEPSLWAALDGAGDARSIVIMNQCSGPVALGAPRLRRGVAGFSFSPTGPVNLAAGAVTTITIHAGPGAEVEDVLFLDASTPTLERRAVTLTVPDP